MLRLTTAINYVGYTLPKDRNATPEQRRFDALQLIANAVLDDPSLPNNRFGRPGLVLLTELGEQARTAADQHENEQATGDATRPAEDAGDDGNVDDQSIAPARADEPSDGQADSHPDGHGNRDSASDPNSAAAQQDTPPAPPAQPRRRRPPRRLAELLGDGPLSEAAAAQLAAHRHTRLVGYDPAVVETCDHRRGYQIPDRLVRHVGGYWRYCAFPGCSVPAHRCDLDHVRPWAGRADLRLQPDPALPLPPPAQDAHHLAAAAPTGLRRRVGQPHRARHPRLPGGR